MKLHLLNTIDGLRPCADPDYDQKKRLKIGSVYEAEIREVRNYQFLRKYFALIRCAYAFLTPSQQEFIKSPDGLRKTVQIAAGYCEVYYSIKRKEWVEESKSIAFDKMTESEFSEVYEGVRLVLFTYFLKHVDEATFMRELVNF
jgi:hypothetical protein